MSATPCSIPECNTDGTGEPCDRHETEQAHREGEHEFCDVTCDAKFPSEQLRNAILCRAIPGSANMLGELERRATAAARSACICGHPEGQHFEDACITEITGCSCGDFLTPEAATEVIDRLVRIVREQRPAPDDELRQAIAQALADHRGSLTTHVPTEHTCCADAVLPLVAARDALPRRGDRFETWLKAQRDLCFGHATSWDAVDGLLDQYRLHADTGTPLDQHVCESNHCDCLPGPDAAPSVVPVHQDGQP